MPATLSKGFTRRGVVILACFILVVATGMLLASWVVAAMAGSVINPPDPTMDLNEQYVSLAKFIYYPAQFMRYLSAAALLASIGMLLRRNWGRLLMLGVCGIMTLTGIALIGLIAIGWMTGNDDSFDLKAALLMMVPFALMAGIAWPLFRRLRSTETIATFNEQTTPK